jgi:hypothetical protein
VSFGLLKIEASVAFLAGFFSVDTVILNNGFDGVKGITAEKNVVPELGKSSRANQSQESGSSGACSFLDLGFRSANHRQPR